jgi:hypothetical protein
MIEYFKTQELKDLRLEGKAQEIIDTIIKKTEKP